MADLSGSKYLGSWKLDSVSMLSESGHLDHDHYLILKADGTATFGSEEYEWKETKEGFRLDGKSDLKFKDEGDKLTAKILFVTLNFIKAE